MSAVFAIGGGFGLVLSGVIIDNASWRWLFIVGAIGVAIAIVLVHRFVPESPSRLPPGIDFAGAPCCSRRLIALLVALTEGENWGWASGADRPRCSASAVVLAVAWALVELRVPEPMVDMRMLAFRRGPVHEHRRR